MQMAQKKESLYMAIPTHLKMLTKRETKPENKSKQLMGPWGTSLIMSKTGTLPTRF